MTEQKGRDNEEVVTRRDGMTDAAGADMDLPTARDDAASTGTSPRAGLGGTTTGTESDPDPSVGSGMANPADMGDQG